MNPLWSYSWPTLTAGLLIGLLTGIFGFRRGARRNAALTTGAAVSLALAGLWHGPVGAAERFAAQVELDARTALDNYEMTKISAHLHRGPLTRRLILSGPADDFQTGELARLLSQLPGVSRAQWASRPGGAPLLLEGAAISILGFLLGLLLAYLVELHRRYNAQWNW